MKKFKFEDMKTLRIFGEAVMREGHEIGQQYASVNLALPSNHPLVIEKRDELREHMRLVAQINDEIHRMHVNGLCTDDDCAAKSPEESAVMLADTRAALAKLYARLDADQAAGDALGEMNQETALAVALVTAAGLDLPGMLSALGANVIFVDETPDGSAVVVSKFEDGK